MTNKEWHKLLGVTWHELTGAHLKGDRYKCSCGVKVECDFAQPPRPLGHRSPDFLNPGVKEHSIMEDWCLDEVGLEVEFRRLAGHEIVCRLRMSLTESWRDYGKTKTLALRGAIEEYVKRDNG